MKSPERLMVMIAGPNGAGKTTAAMAMLGKYLDIHEFVNADELARGLNPLHPDREAMAAGRLMLARIQSLMTQGKSFAFETTAAGLHYLKIIQQAKAAGYQVHLIFLWLPNAEMAIRRVAQRVSKGGHAIPEETIRRRYSKGLRNLVECYLKAVDSFSIEDRSEETTVVIADKMYGEAIHIYKPDLWQEIKHG
jgi:predicted ABC-type ATPase